MNDKEDIKLCAFYGTMAAVFTAGAALTMDSTVLKAIGTGMVFWVLGFLGTMSACIQISKDADEVKE
jgi:hypothetical protein